MASLRFGRARSLLVCTLLSSSWALFGAVASAAPAEGDRATAESRIQAWGRDPATRDATRQAEKKVREALRRAEDARTLGDQRQRQRLEALARTWAETGDDAARAAKLEERVRSVQRELAAIKNKIDRTRALLEETLARVGRAREQIRRLEAERAAPTSPSIPEKTP